MREFLSELNSMMVQFTLAQLFRSQILRNSLLRLRKRIVTTRLILVTQKEKNHGSKESEVPRPW